VEKCPPEFAASGHILVSDSALQRTDVLSLPALGSLGYVELHALAFLQAAEAIGLDRGEMHENVFASLPADKAVALGIVKPLYCSLFCHFVAYCPFQIVLRWKGSEVQRAGLAGLQEAAQQPIQIKRTLSVSDEANHRRNTPMRQDHAECIRRIRIATT